MRFALCVCEHVRAEQREALRGRRLCCCIIVATFSPRKWGSPQPQQTPSLRPIARPLCIILDHTHYPFLPLISVQVRFGPSSHRLPVSKSTTLRALLIFGTLVLWWRTARACDVLTSAMHQDVSAVTLGLVYKKHLKI